MSTTPISQIASADAATARASRQDERAQWLASHPGDTLPRPIDPHGPTLSVVVTVHNVGPWIGELLESLQAQTFTDVEYLLVDDHSTDESAAAVDAIAAADARFRVIRPTNRGGAHARNIGADHARGRLLAFCDGDDIVPRHAYEALVAAADGQDVVFGDYLKFFPERTWHPTKNVFGEPRTNITLADLPELLYYRAVWNKVFRTEFWRDHDIVFPEVKRSNDIVPMVTAYVAARSLALVPDVAYLYRDRPGASSMSSKVGSRDSLRSYLRQEQACSDLVSNHPASEAFQRLFAVRDGWVQVSRYLLNLDGDPVDPEIVDRVRHLWSLVEPNIRHKLDVDRHATFVALAGPTPQDAEVTAFGLNPMHALEDPDRWLVVARQLLDDHRDLLTAVGDLPDVIGETFTRGLRRLLLADLSTPGSPEIGPVQLDLIRDLLAAIERACGERPSSVHNLNLRLHGALDALERGDLDAMAERMIRSRQFSMELTTVTRIRGGLRLAGEMTTVDGLAPEHLVKRLGGAHRPIARVDIDPEAPHRWSATLSRPQLAPSRKHRINVSGRIGSDEELFHLAHAEGLGNHTARLATSRLELFAPRDQFVVQVRWIPRAARTRRAAGRLRRWLARG